MKHYLRSLIIAAIAFYVTITLIPTITVGNDPKNMAMVIGGIFITAIAVHPVFSIVLLPINILTFGLLSLILNVVLLFALTRFVPGFAISAYNFMGANIQGFVIPAANLNQIETILAAAIIITVVQKVLHVVFD